MASSSANESSSAEASSFRDMMKAVGDQAFTNFPSLFSGFAPGSGIDDPAQASTARRSTSDVADSMSENAPALQPSSSGSGLAPRSGTLEDNAAPEPVVSLQIPEEPQTQSPKSDSSPGDRRSQGSGSNTSPFSGEAIPGVTSQRTSPTNQANPLLAASVETASTIPNGSLSPQNAGWMGHTAAGGSSGSRSQPQTDHTACGGRTAFAEQLAAATQNAPQRLAERLSEQLQQNCLEEAGLGQSSFTWDTTLPSGSRSFMQEVAKAFVSRTEALGFEKVEWWNGREWKQSLGRYHILHDNVYDKYHMKIQVRWLDRLPPEEHSPKKRTHQRNWSMTSQASQGQEENNFERFLEKLEEQRQYLEEELSRRRQIADADQTAQAAEIAEQRQRRQQASIDQHSLRSMEERSLSVDSYKYIIEEAPAAS